MNQCIGKDVQETAQQFDGIPLPIDDPECNKISIQLRQSFTQCRAIFGNTGSAPGCGIYHQTMAGKFVSRIDQLYPPSEISKSISFFVSFNIKYGHVHVTDPRLKYRGQ